LSSGSTHRRAAKDAIRLGEDTRARDGVVWLRNEFIEASINTTTGSLQTFKDYHARGNRLSQQVALRGVATPGKPGDTWQNPDATSLYSVMAADSTTVVASSPASGEVESRGRLLLRDGRAIAQFRQRWRLFRGSRVLYLEIELQPQQDVSSDPWNSYYACRFAWSDETAELYHSLNQTRQRISKQRIEAPLYIELDSGARRTTLLMGGLPYHRRIGERMLDSLLIVRGESQRVFRIGIGLDLPQPLPEALALLAPNTVMFQRGATPAPANCWLFHLDAKSVVATHWSPLWEGETLVGVRVRLLESGGKSVRVRLAAFRPFTTARQVNFLGEIQSDLSVEQGRIVLDIAAHEWVEVEGRWRAPGGSNAV
jgi:alpha-mannosidase